VDVDALEVWGVQLAARLKLRKRIKTQRK
jgi:hypothetical protein